MADTLGWIHANKGQLERALKPLRHAVAAAPSNPELYATIWPGRWPNRATGRVPARSLQSLLAKPRDPLLRRDAETLPGRL